MMKNIDRARLFSITVSIICASVLPGCALFYQPSTTASPPVAVITTPSPDVPPQAEASPPDTGAATVSTTAAAVPAAPNRYMQVVKEKKALFEMDMRNEPACKTMATSFGRASPGERPSAAVRCNPKSMSAVLPVSAVMKNQKTKSNYIARFPNKEFCTRVIDSLAQNGKSTVVRNCLDRKKS